MANLADLTPRELDVLIMLFEGRTNRSMATEFRVTEKTIEFHLSNIYSKTGARSRLDAVLWAIQQGIKPETRVIPS
jgi:DNA-binding NarL/FixJ family response regulator